MKKLLLLAFALLGVAVQGVAQEVKIPKFVTFVMPKSNSVNIRQAPSAQSAKLVWKQTGNGYWNGQFTWEEKEDKTAVPAMKKFADKSVYPVFPVIEVTGEWYHILFNEMGDTYDAYILKSLCMSMQQKPITESFVKGYLEYDYRDEGKYKGFTLMRGRLYMNDGPGELLFVGRMIEGVCVGKDMDPMGFMDNEQAIQFYSDLSSKTLRQITDGQIDRLFGFLVNDSTKYLYGVPGIYKAWNGGEWVLDQQFGIFSITSKVVEEHSSLFAE